MTPRLPVRTWCLALCASALFVALSRAEEKPASPTYLNQGWDAKTRQEFYFTTQGSQIIPYEWFLVLEQPENDKLFNDPEFIAKLRYLPMPKNKDRNPDGLPVGFVKDENAVTVLMKLSRLAKGVDKTAYPSTNKWLGLTCAACHTNRIDYNKKSIIVDGAPAQADFQRFLELLVESLKATHDDNTKFGRFAKKVLASGSPEADKKALRERLKAFFTDLDDEVKRNSTGPNPKHRYGFARLDAFGRILNNACAEATKIPENAAPANAPVSYPFLWDTPMLDWVQWNGAASNPLGRNIGEVLGVFAQLELTANPKADLFRSSANIRTLGRLENILKGLNAPAWPDDLFGKPDADKAKTGKALFAENCASCHGVRDAAGKLPSAGKNPDGPELIKITMVPLKDIKTDPTMATNFLTRRVKPGALTSALKDAIGKDGKVPAVAFLTAAVQGVMERKFREAEPPFKKETLAELAGNRPSKTPTVEHLSGYKARPLNGIWATAPYMHNGSVANLYEVLLPAKDRKKTFWVGSRTFDPKLVGFVSDKDKDYFEFDTTVPGNSNAGHEGPTYTQTKDKDGKYRDFTEAERMALVEYMKTLK